MNAICSPPFIATSGVTGTPTGSVVSLTDPMVLVMKWSVPVVALPFGSICTYANSGIGATVHAPAAGAVITVAIPPTARQSGRKTRRLRIDSPGTTRLVGAGRLLRFARHGSGFVSVPAVSFGDTTSGPPTATTKPVDREIHGRRATHRLWPGC